MIRHLIRIVWNRRRSNLLIAIEIFLSFIVLVSVVTAGVFLADNYRQPLGYSYQNTWYVRMAMHAPEMEEKDLPSELTPAGRRARVAVLMGLVRDLPEVVSVAASMNAPYGTSSWTSSVTVGGRSYDFAANAATDDFAATMELTITRGRWFGREDDGAAWRPTVINERLARAMFGGEDPVGKVIQPDPPKVPDRFYEPAMRVVGVISDFRIYGELEPAGNYAFYPAGSGPRVPRYLLVRTRPGTAARFEETLVSRLQAAEPDWSFLPQHLVRARSAVLRGYLPGIAASALVAVFLLTMVMVGLTGVLWLTVTQRTREIGLRRAKGATAPNIQSQMVGEVLILTTLAVIVGVVVVAQFPLLDVFGAVQTRVFATGLAVSLALIYLLAIACAWAPGRLASSIDPAEALRYE